MYLHDFGQLTRIIKENGLMIDLKGIFLVSAIVCDMNSLYIYGVVA